MIEVPTVDSTSHVIQRDEKGDGDDKVEEGEVEEVEGEGEEREMEIEVEELKDEELEQP
jgi:hypothetical protein